MAAGPGTERCSCTRGGQRAGSIPALRKQQNPPCKPNKHWPSSHPRVCARWLQSTGEWDGVGAASKPELSLQRGTASGLPLSSSMQRAQLCLCLPQAHAIKGACTHLHMLFCGTTSPGTLQSRFLLEKKEDQRHMTVIVLPLHALLEDTHSPQQLQLGNGKCLNRTAWSSSPGSTAPTSGCHSSIWTQLPSPHLPQPGNEVAVQIPGRCRCMRVTTSLLNGSRLPTRWPAWIPASQHR